MRGKPTLPGSTKCVKTLRLNSLTPDRGRQRPLSLEYLPREGKRTPEFRLIMQNDERAIRNLVAAWLDASKAGDLETVLSLMADDVVFLVPGREPFGKEAFAASSKEMKNVHIEGTSEILELQISGNWAWMRNSLNLTNTPPNGKPIARSGYSLTILRKKPEGQWVLARDANLLSDPKT